MLKFAPAPLLLLLLLACSDQDPPAAPERDAPGGAPAAAAAQEGPALAVDSQGLRLFAPASGSARPIAFDTPWPQALGLLAFRGAPGTGTNRKCGAGALDYASWPDGLTIYSQNGRFVGWALDQRAARAIGTAAGVGPGSTRAELEEAHVAEFSQTTLGTEFAAGELFGVLDGTGANSKITAMWGGVSCNFR
jgi:hypothetical protein